MLLAARAAGHSRVTVDGTLIRTGRCHVPGPTAWSDRSGRQVDLWWSGEHAAHGGNIQVIGTPDGWPIWTSPARLGRDTTALHTHLEAGRPWPSGPTPSTPSWPISATSARR